MEKIRLGRTEMMVTRLGFGGIPIQRLEEGPAVATVRACLDMGVNFIDTAHGYTTSEGRIGKAVAGRRQDVILGTKSPHRTRAEVEADLELSLKRLGVDDIDLYMLHNVSDAATLEKVMAPGGPLAFLQGAKQAGLVRHIGASSHQIDTARDIVKSGEFETVMFPFNFITHEPADELIPLARAHDVGFIVMKPLGGGMLADVSLAFKFLLQYPDLLIIPGIQEPAEMEEILRIESGPHSLTAADRREIERLRRELGQNFCRRCDYCQPCTEGIHISTVMTSDTFFKRLNMELIMSGSFGQAVEDAVKCSQCGLCEERCPYHLPIREMIAARSRAYQEAKRQYRAGTATGD
ncbi:MAG: aldo/keto reductase [Chloroflexota bacterium]